MDEGISIMISVSGPDRNSLQGTFPYDREEGWYNPNGCPCAQYEHEEAQNQYPWQKREELRNAPGLIKQAGVGPNLPEFQ